MKTTVDIADDLLLRAKDVAREEEITLKQLMEEGLRTVLDRREERVRPVRIKPVVVKGRGRAPDLSWDRLGELLYGPDERPVKP